jgi:preprotein translocase subunit SecD
VGQDYEINFTLKPEAAEKFGAWTAANINQYLGVVFNDEVKSIAYIKSQIFDTGQIEGHYTKESAEDLAQILVSGPLPAAVKIVEEGQN